MAMVLLCDLVEKRLIMDMALLSGGDAAGKSMVSFRACWYFLMFNDKSACPWIYHYSISPMSIQGLRYLYFPKGLCGVSVYLVHNHGNMLKL